MADKTCRNGENNGEKCLYDHSGHEYDGIMCNNCDESFKFKSQFLKHRKEKHPTTVPECKSIKEGKICQFKENFGFDHKDANNPKEHRNNDITKQNKDSTKETQNPNFWESSSSIKPPDQLEEMKQMMQTMMSDILLLKKSIGKETKKN